MTAFDRILDGLFVGGDPEYSDDVQADITVLNQEVDLIIDCRSAEEARLGGWANYSNLDVPILHVPMYDDFENENSIDDFLGALAVVKQDYPNAQRFFIHCHMGVNRGPSMALFFLIQRFDLTAKEAFELLREKREGVGIAYAEQAVAASLVLADGQVDADINMWIQFEDDYWTAERMASVRERIMRNRRRASIGRMTGAGKYVRGN